MSVSSDQKHGLPPEPQRPDSGPVVEGLARISFLVGALGLLLSMVVEAAAVLGRHLGHPLLGSIEVVQASVVLMGSSALVGTTLRARHASVHLLTERLSGRPRDLVQRLAHALSALFFSMLALGSLIVLRDLWDGDERSELLRLPYAPLRAFFIASTLLVVVLFLAAAVARRSSSRTHEP